jgi:hypothetical protein
MKDIQKVLEQKLRELRELQQQVACLKIVIPILVDETADVPSVITECLCTIGSVNGNCPVHGGTPKKNPGIWP